MSTRQLLNITLGVVALLAAGALAIPLVTGGDGGDENLQIDLAQRQQAHVQTLVQQVDDLVAAADWTDVETARTNLARTIVSFDNVLAAQMHGGQVETGAGIFDVPRLAGPGARTALERAAGVWLQTGVPLADLAAGEYSVFSAAGRQAADNLEQNQVELIELMGEVATSLRTDLKARQATAGYARLAGLVLAAVAVVLGIVRIRLGRKVQSPATPARSSFTAAPESATDDAPAVETATAPLQVSHSWQENPHQPFRSPVDFNNVNAAVDQMSVDMNTIAGSTDKMRLAIDSVGHALQGMLYSLNEMAQDTAEGYKVVRGANNAASYTATAANELGESAREMSRVVARVTQLAMKTKQVAAQIDAEAVNTGQTGEAFTSVVATEVKGLAGKTSEATATIENTVNEILSTARQYEEAIGQIIKNISSINKVSQNLGELMLNPPATVVPGEPLAQAQPQVLAPTPQPAPAPEPEPALEPALAAEPAIEQAAEPAPAVEPVPEPVPEPAPEAVIEDDPVEPEPTAEEVAEDTSEAIAEVAAEPEEEDSGDSNIFMLNKPRKSRPKVTDQPVPEPVAEATPEPTVETAPEVVPEAAAEPEPEPEAEKEDSGANIFMLNKPNKAQAPAAEQPAVPEPEPVAEPEPAPEPAAEAAPEPEPEAEKEDGGANIFMLNKPNKAQAPAAEQPAAPEPEPEPEPTAEPEAEAEEAAVTVPADDDGEEEDSGGNNIFMLNKPNK